MNRSVMAAFAAFAAIAMIAAGCGGGSDTTSGSSEGSDSLTKSEFLKQGNAICAKGNKEIEEGFEEFVKEHNLSEKKQPSKAELEEVSETVLIPKVRGQIEGIKALGTPGGDEGEVEAILAAAEEALEKGEEDPNLLTQEGSGPFAKANKLSREYGLVKCGEEEGEEG